MGKQLRNWCFTLYKSSGGEDLDSTSDYAQLLVGVDNVRCAVWQLERCPETERLHIQGYVEFTGAKRMGAVKRILGESAHLEGRRGTKTEAIEYCRKEESRVLGPWTVGDLDECRPGARTDLDELSSAILSGNGRRRIMEEYPSLYIRYSRGVENLLNLRARYATPEWRDIQCSVYYGTAGAGKTRRAVEESNGDYYILQQGERLWFDGYENQGTLIIDDFYGWVKYGTLLALLDGYPYRAEIKGGFVYASWTKVVITSNDAPEQWYTRGLTDALKRRIHNRVHFDIPFQ